MSIVRLTSGSPTLLQDPSGTSVLTGTPPRQAKSRSWFQSLVTGVCRRFREIYHGGSKELSATARLRAPPECSTASDSFASAPCSLLTTHSRLQHSGTSFFP